VNKAAGRLLSVPRRDGRHAYGCGQQRRLRVSKGYQGVSDSATVWPAPVSGTVLCTIILSPLRLWHGEAKPENRNRGNTSEGERGAVIAGILDDHPAGRS
jgi:hypothetical protein